MKNISELYAKKVLDRGVVKVFATVRKGNRMSGKSIIIGRLK